MRSTFVNKPAALALACTLALAAFSPIAGAQAADEHALLNDSSGKPVMSGTGLCVHTGFGPAPSWTSGCHPRVAALIATAAPVAAPASMAAADAAPAYEKVVFDANVMFDSNKSELRPAGRDTLDQFVGKIRGLESQSVMAIGYADRMGTEGANQILSEERVAAVKSYLVGKGVAADRVKTSGWGETRPTTSLSDCKDANNAKNVACMQPDRHVFIEISGTRLTQ
jgi:OOP family OmpA-OmpF porin